MADVLRATPRPVTPTTILAAELRDMADVMQKLAQPGTECSIDIIDALTRRLRAARDLAEGLDPYLDRCTTPESEALTSLARRTQEMDWASRELVSGSGPLEQEMLSGHLEGQVLKFLVALTGSTRVLEIGMFTGYSALAMAEALPPGGRVVACEVDPFVADFARQRFADSPVGDRITVEVGPALDTLRELDGQSDPFGLVFIDADKTGYVDYYDFLLDSDLLAPNCVVAVDNTLMQGAPYATADRRTDNGDAIDRFNRYVADDSRVEQVLLPLRDGLTLIRRVQE